MTASLTPRKEEQLARALSQYDRLQTFFPRVESRATFLLGTDVGLATLTILNYHLDHQNVWLMLCGSACLLAFLVGMAFAFSTFFTHLKGAAVSSLIYFGDVAALKPVDYFHKARAASMDDMLDDALCQVWRNSEILNQKFKRVKASFVATAIAIPLWIAFLAISVAQTGTLPIFKAG